MASLILIAAVARNGAIGKDNRLLWHLPEDMKRFKALTLGNTVLMGRKTWESLPEKFRPLPGRHNIVLSRNNELQLPGAALACTLEQAVLLAGKEDIYVIGGGAIYELALSHANRLELTEVDDAPVGDTFFPKVDSCIWKETAREARPATATTPAYAFVTYERATQST